MLSVLNLFKAKIGLTFKQNVTLAAISLVNRSYWFRLQQHVLLKRGKMPNILSGHKSKARY